MGSRRFLSQGLLALTLVLWGGCGLFEPRDPRVEVTIPPEPCRAQVLPDSVIANIVAHYAIGTACYGNQLADSVDALLPGFHFLPDIQDYSVFANRFDGWNKQVELGVTQSISSDYDTLIVIFDPDEYDGRVTSQNPDRETRFYNYRVLAVNGPADTTHYQGQAELTMVRPTSDWYLETFRDHRDGSGLPTWGVLRVEHRSGL